MTGYPTPSLIAGAMAKLQDTSLMSAVTLQQRADLVAVSFGILRDARAARLGPRASDIGQSSVTYVTSAEFRQGRLAQHRRPRLVVLPTTPGDAA